jgi:type VII secretion protein EccE
MNRPPAAVRAVARVATNERAAPAVVSVLARRRPGYLGVVNVSQLLLVEAALALAVAAFSRGIWMVTGTAIAGLAVAATTFGRWRGHWWVERILMNRRYRHRRMSGPATGTDRRLVALHSLAPDLSVVNVEGADGTRVGVARDDAGWYAVTAVAAPGGLRGEVQAALPLDRLVRVIAESDQPGVTVQVVVHTAPAPSLELDPRHRSATSYQELLRRYGAVPANQSVWVAVRLDARTLAEAAIDGTDESDLAPAAVAGLARRVGKTLHTAGLANQVLDADGLLDALVRSCYLERPSRGVPLEHARESWQAWHASGLTHVCYWVSTWPTEAGARRVLLDRLAGAPAAVTSVALDLQPRTDGTDLRCVVRVAADPDALAQACAATIEIAENAGARLLRLDGEQAPAVYASAPTGGGAR